LPDLDEGTARALLDHAAAAIRSGLRHTPIAPDDYPRRPSALDELGATFVTLERDDELLGCIGTIEAVRPLFEDVMQNAYKSAFADPRVPTVTAADFEVMTIKVSVLSPLESLGEVPSPAALAGAIEAGVDGVLVDDGRHRATFLPSVWPKVRGPDEFVDLLVRKAGLSPGRWSPGTRAWRYTTAEVTDRGPRSL
jgi:AmmeMemoRadiSam system protein A